MLDLNFVRDNLPRVEEMLRQRGADSALRRLIRLRRGGYAAAPRPLPRPRPILRPTSFGREYFRVKKSGAGRYEAAIAETRTP